MKVAIYNRSFYKEESEFIRSVFCFLAEKKYEVIVNANLLSLFPNSSYFEKNEDLKKAGHLDFFLSLGGDRTLLESANIVRDLQIPIVGINTGRIGFLTGVNKNDFATAFQLLSEGAYLIEDRTLLHLETEYINAFSCNFALNDITLHASRDALLNTIKVWINDKLLNTYWADGLIVATPSGSTAYSLSCGGPIIAPDSKVNVITPIASHSLSVRPIVVSSDVVIKVEMSGRAENFLLTLDHHRTELPNPATITISKELFTIKTVRFADRDFFTVIREKLMWGMDRRNNCKF